MRKLTKADCYKQVLVIAAQKHDNELLLEVVAEMARRVAADIGPELNRLEEYMKPLAEPKGHFDRTDWQTRKQILFTAGMILELLRRQEEPTPRRKRRICCA